eukprot:TRINITY_DN7832_c0_g1_i6.p1 TRINITY_DN7832_c0_g1~~TRINITY_DN7832_c0_g1_i6.p1  ORF type:complete len:126 (-),score=28.32 TRINITY_DN7832_c0_g1_i6:612-989(-)
MGKITTLVGWGTRFGAVGGTVYLFNSIGTFGDVKQGEAALRKIESLSMEQVVGKEIADQVPAIEFPQEITTTYDTVTNWSQDVAKNFPEHWNGGVKTAISALINLPDNTKYYCNSAVEEIKKNIN